MLLENCIRRIVRNPHKVLELLTVQLRECGVSTVRRVRLPSGVPPVRKSGIGTGPTVRVSGIIVHHCGGHMSHEEPEMPLSAALDLSITTLPLSNPITSGFHPLDLLAA